jgi:hypothetical protein
MIIYHQLIMKLTKNVRNYLSGKVLTVHLSNENASEKEILDVHFIATKKTRNSSKGRNDTCTSGHYRIFIQ